MTNVSQASHYTRCKWFSRALLGAGAALWCVAFPTQLSAQQFFPLRDVRPGQHGIGRTVFQGNRIENFDVEILGVLENLTPKQSIILARLSGGPLAQTGIMQGMSGSPVYIDGKLVGAVALGFPFSKEPIAGIQPIEQMIAGARFTPGPSTFAKNSTRTLEFGGATPASPVEKASEERSFGQLSEILTPLTFGGFTSRTLETFAPEFQKMGLYPQQGVGAGTPKSQALSGTVLPGSMISVQLLSGDMSISADGTVTYVDGGHVYAFGHRFLDGGSTDLPFARSDVLAVVPSLNTSFKLSAAREWVGTVVSDRNTAIAGQIGRAAHTIPLSISVHSSETGRHDYHFQVVNDRLLTPFVTQTALFSALDATERSIGAASLRLHGEVSFDGTVPPLRIADIFVSDSGLLQQVSGNAVVYLGFLLGAGFSDLHIKDISFSLEPVETKRQLRIAQAWASPSVARPGETIEITALLQGENGFELTRSASYRIPIGAPTGFLNFSVADALSLNAIDFAGLSQSSLRTPQQLVQVVNAYRNTDAVYLRVWRQEPAFTISGPLPGGDLTDPPPSAMLILADTSSSANSNATLTATRGSEIAELKMSISGYVVSGAKTIQVEVKE